jgi:hypothetical protein
VDLSGNGKNGTLNGDVGFDSEYKAFTFDEANDYITFDTGKTGNYIFSVSLWFKSSGNSIETLFHMNGDYATNNTVWIYGTARSLSIDFVNNDYSCDTGKEIVDNMWHHASFVYNGNGESGRDIYLDGIHLGGSILGSSAGSNLNLTSTSSISRIGALNLSSGITHEFKGSIANFRLYNKALSADEIWELYAYQKEYFGVSPDVVTLKAGRLGIGTSEPRAALDVRGDIRGGCPVIFGCSASSNTARLAAMNWDRVHINKGNGISGTKFTAPLEGYYHMDVQCFSTPGGSNIAALKWQLNGVDNGVSEFSSNDGVIYSEGDGRKNLSGSLIVYMRSGDYIELISSGQVGVSIHSSHNRFNGFYLSS